MECTDNLEINKKENFVLVSVNPKIYPLNVIYAAAYVFIDRAYVIIDGNPEEGVIVELKAKGKEDLKKLGYEFNNELLNYAVYEGQAKDNSEVRAVLIKRALLTNGEEETEDDFIEDPEGIAVPWEEKYGKKD